MDYLAIARLMWAGADSTVEAALDPRSVLYRRLWGPLLLAALNTDPAEGSARLAGRIVRETLLAGGAKCRPLIAADGLSEAFVEPALAALAARGTDVCFGTRLRAIAFGEERAEALDFGSETLELWLDVSLIGLSSLALGLFISALVKSADKAVTVLVMILVGQLVLSAPAIPKIEDAPWPGYPADLTSIAVVGATQSEGTVLIFEKMFESRLFFVDRLASMGARLILCDPHRVVVSGRSQLIGQELVSPDIRAGMALLIAALCADGTSTIQNIQQIDRGYERIDQRLAALGARIERRPS